MGFTTPVFLFLFFPLCVAGYYLLLFFQTRLPVLARLRLKDLFLILAGLGFYAWACLDNVALLLVFCCCAAVFGRLIARVSGNGKKALAVLAVGVVLMVAALLYYKYFSYLTAMANQLARRTLFGQRTILAPLGISFITFSGISYLMDVYRGEPAGSILDVLLYLTFFPKVVSGPIVLWKDFRGQIGQRRENTGLFVDGLNAIVIGFGKKVILADTFGALVASIQVNTAWGIDVPTAWGCTFLYMLEIYYDFSGYSDIAIGLARLFGFDLKKNFDFPYISTSITEFWKRWHISLGSWFREYVYIPLGGNRKGYRRTLVNLAVVFLLTGIWHGTGMGYLCWGILHGACRIFEKCVEHTKVYERIPKWIKWLGTMFVVMMGWQVFRLGHLTDVIDFTKIMLGITKFDIIYLSWQYFFTKKIIVFIVIAVLGATVLSGKDFARLKERISENPVLFALQEIVLLALLVLSILFMVNSSYSPFIYFQY